MATMPDTASCWSTCWPKTTAGRTTAASTGWSSRPMAIAGTGSAGSIICCAGRKSTRRCTRRRGDAATGWRLSRRHDPRARCARDEWRDLIAGHDMPRDSIFHPEYKPRPYWWDAYEPTSGALVHVPKEARVAIVGGGYAGLAAALEFAKHGVEAVVLERGPLGIGASTRNGGSVSGGVNIGKSFSGRAAEVAPERAQALLADAADAFSLIERLIEDEQIECNWQKRGRFVGAWTPKHYTDQEKRLAGLNDAAQSGAYMVPRDQQRAEIASDYYHVGMVVERSASLHPAPYYKGLLDACRRQGIAICAEASVERIKPLNGAGWRVETSGGPRNAAAVDIATNRDTVGLNPAFQHGTAPI